MSCCLQIFSAPKKISSPKALNQKQNVPCCEMPLQNWANGNGKSWKCGLGSWTERRKRKRKSQKPSASRNPIFHVWRKKSSESYGDNSNFSPDHRMRKQQSRRLSNLEAGGLRSSTTNYMLSCFLSSVWILGQAYSHLHTAGRKSTACSLADRRCHHSSSHRLPSAAC